MRARTVLPVVVPLVFPGCSTPGSEVVSYGTVHEALGEGRTEARVELADLALPGMWGVGALAGLAGEVTIADGKVWVTSATPGAHGTVIDPAGARATILFAGRVVRWRHVPVPVDVAAAGFDAFVAAEAQKAGVDAARPFVFRVTGPLRELRCHVIRGSCPMRPVPGAEPPLRDDLARVNDGELVGIHARDGGGRFTHHGHASHVHVLLREGGPRTAHVESVSVEHGAVLLLPVE